MHILRTRLHGLYVKVLYGTGIVHTFPPKSCTIRVTPNTNEPTTKRSDSISRLLRMKILCTWLSLLIHVHGHVNSMCKDRPIHVVRLVCCALR
jgi:hypothetical protein